MDLPFLHIDIETLVNTLGYIGLFAVIFAESGLFFGFFLPGDSLLFTAGLLASQGYFNILILILILAGAAISGDSVGYWFGRKVGPRIFTREDSRFFHKRHLEFSKNFYDKYGPFALVAARFVPIARTFVPILAGVGEMNYAKFIRYNVAGGLLWSCGVTLIAFFLGKSFPAIENYMEIIIIFIILTSFIPFIIKFFNHKSRT